MKISVKTGNLLLRGYQDCELAKRQLKAMEFENGIQEKIIGKQDSSIRAYLDLTNQQATQISTLKDDLKDANKKLKGAGVFSRLSTVCVAVLAVLLIVK